MEMMDYLRTMLLIMFFYSVSITLITHYLPSPVQVQVSAFTNVGNGIDLNGTAAKVQSSMDRQLSLPLVEIGALVFYSGNILLDLLLNFIFAIPQMIALLISALCNLINLPAFISTTVQIFTSVIMVLLYLISLIQLITNVRSGRLV